VRFGKLLRRGEPNRAAASVAALRAVPEENVEASEKRDAPLITRAKLCARRHPSAERPSSVGHARSNFLGSVFELVEERAMHAMCAMLSALTD
jgi:hypothetical protein